MKTSSNPVEMLREDHKKVKQLFKKFKQAKNHEEKKEISREAINDLKVHAVIEEEIFYPSVKEESNETELINEAIEEHHIVHGLINELESQDLEPEQYEAKFKVLSEAAEHHIEKEESEILPLMDGEADEELEQLGEAMMGRRQQLLEGESQISKASEKAGLEKHESEEEGDEQSSTGKRKSGSRKRRISKARSK